MDVAILEQITYDSDCNAIMDAKVDFAAENFNDPENYQQTATFGPHGNVLAANSYLTHWNSATSFWEPSALPSTSTSYYDIDEYFQKSGETDPDSHTTSYGIGSSQAGTTGYSADTNPGDRGQVLSVTDPAGNDSSSPDYGKQYTYAYNLYGQKISETNLNGVVTRYYYGGDGSSYDLTDPSSASDTGNLIAVFQDPGDPATHVNRITRMAYDVMGHVVSAVDPKGNITKTQYNAAGQPLSVQSYAASNLITPAESIAYGYGADGRTESVADNRGTTTITYEDEAYGGGSAASPAASYGGDRIYSVSDPQTGAISYTYTPLGARSTMTLPGGGTWTYGYAPPPHFGDSWNGYYSALVMPDCDPDKVAQALTSITDDAGRTVQYQMSWMGALHQALYDVTYKQGSVYSSMLTGYHFDDGTGAYGSSTWANGWGVQRTTSQITAWNGPINSLGPASQTRLVSRNDYTYDNAGLRLSNTISTQALDGSGYPVVDSNQKPVVTGRTETYGYDDLSRLKTVDYGDGETQSYAFDAMGNRQSLTDTIAQGSPAAGTSGQGGTATTSYTPDDANRLTSVTFPGASAATTVTSDADGNTLTDQQGRTFTWDTEDRMASCTLPNGGGTTTFTYGADGLRRSMTATVSGVSRTTDFVYDGTMLVREMQVDLNEGDATFNQLIPTATYFNGARGPEYRRSDAPGNLFVKWYVYDGLGSVVGEVDPSGNILASGQYDVYGAARGTTASGTASSRQGFVGGLGHQTDPETGGLIYMQARYYDSSTGRFVSEDPGMNGENLFEYCKSNPVDNLDRTGKYSYIGVGMALGWFIYLTTKFIESDNFADFKNDVKYMWGMALCCLMYNIANVASSTFRAIRQISQEATEGSKVPWAYAAVAALAGYSLFLLFACDWCDDFESSGSGK